MFPVIGLLWIFVYIYSGRCIVKSKIDHLEMIHILSFMTVNKVIVLIHMNDIPHH